MHLIAHRGNTNGPNRDLENSPDYVKNAILDGFEVEIDVWENHGKLYLGHDAPTYQINIDFLLNDSCWCHAKNLNALNILLQNGAHCFWHENDEATLTSRGYVWTYPGKPLIDNSVCLLFKLPILVKNWAGATGICSDYVRLIQSIL